MEKYTCKGEAFEEPNHSTSHLKSRHSMEFTTKEITKLTEITAANISQHLKFGFYEPSISKSTGRGSSKNIWSLGDAYKVRIFNDLVNRGWSRKIVAGFINSINPHGLSHFIALGMHLRARFLNMTFLASLPKAHREALQKPFTEHGPAVGLWLIFYRSGDDFHSQPAIEDDPRYSGLDLQIPEGIRLSEVVKNVKNHDDIYIYNLCRALDIVDLNLIKHLPDKASVFFEIYHKNIASTFGDSNKLSWYDIIESLERIIGG